MATASNAVARVRFEVMGSSSSRNPIQNRVGQARYRELTA